MYFRYFTRLFTLTTSKHWEFTMTSSSAHPLPNESKTAFGSMTWANEPPSEAEKARVAVQRELIRSVLSGELARVRVALDACVKCSHGFDINYSSSGKMTALNTACIKGDHEIVSVILNAGANIESANSIGCTPLVTAVCNGHSGVVSLLLSAKASKSVTLRDGRTPAALAREYGFFEIEKLLL